MSFSAHSKYLALNPKHLKISLLLSTMLAISACSKTSSDTENDGTGSSADNDITEEVGTIETPEETLIEPTEQDITLRTIIENLSIDEEIITSHLPDISEALPQLGMKLFYSQSLGGDFDAACVTCHHPGLGGGDDLSLPVGVGAVTPTLLGTGRVHSSGLPEVPRNAPTIFNTGLWDTTLFLDSRVESIGKEPDTNGSISSIRTPDSDFLVADLNAGANLAAAQARFPVTSTEEMKSDQFEVGSDNETIRNHLAARIGNYGEGEGELVNNNWLVEFQEALGSSSTAEELITFDNIAFAIGEYERSMVFIQSPWQNYVEGDLAALNEQEKSGAQLFFTPVSDGGAGCVVCHNGKLLSDGLHHNIAFPQVGPGKGNTNNDDFGRERETGDADHRYQFRTASLLNIAQTAPYGHNGSYQNLEEVVRHYINPNRAVENFFDRGGVCSLPQFRDVENCNSLYPNNETNSTLALNKLNDERRDQRTLFESPRLNDNEVMQVVAFLEALSDPCVTNRECLNDWIPDTTTTGPDGQQLNGTSASGEFL
jgi:cytochrome c peroxidase